MKTVLRFRALLPAALVSLALAGLAELSLGQDPFGAEDDAPKFQVAEVTVDPAAVPAGSTAQVRVRVTIADLFHIYGLDYSDPPILALVDLPEGLSVQGVTEDPPAHESNAIPGFPTLDHKGEVVFSIALRVAEDMEQGPRTVRGTLTAMACDESSCLQPETLGFTAAFDVVAPVPQSGKAAPVESVPETAGDDPDDASSASAWSLIKSGFFWGLITLLTPCVFPLLPVTVSFFSKQEGSVLPKALVYAFGMIFTLAGVGMALGSALDLFARGDLFNLFIGTLFVVLALSLFGLFDIRLPGKITDATTKRSGMGGLVGPFFMAVTLGLTSFSCSIPFLVGLFATFDEGVNQWNVFIGVLTYATTVAFPFFLCSLFPALLKSMPRAGGWMNAVKVTMGFVELGLAFKFFRTVALNHDSTLLPRSMVLAIWAACCFGAALYLLGWITLPKDTKSETIGVVRLLFALMFLSLGFYIVPGTFGRPLYPDIEGFIQTTPADLAPIGAAGGGNGGGETAHLAWPKNDWDGAIERAAAAKRYVLFDFTGKG